ncbi:ABC transporter substrate-binding protein [Deinococcus psychrotolerans]|nr:ABC transporter substrate-binding protein [Deinococcus psychrotolerans]
MSHLSQRSLSVLLLTAFMAASTNGAAQSQGAPVRGGTLTVAQQADIVGLDPATLSAASSSVVVDQIYDSLTTITPDGQPAPAIAQSWKISADGKTYTFTLRPGVKFSDGRALTSRDVVYSIKRVLDPKLASPRRGDLLNITSIEAPSPNQVVIKLKASFAPFLIKMADQTMGVMPSGYAEGKDLNKVPLGSGPFKFVRWVPGDSVTLERNPYYWEKNQPYVDQLVFKAVKDDVSRIINLQSGLTDIAMSVPFNQIDSLKTNSSVKLVGGSSSNYDEMSLNNKVKPFSDVRVRQAISYAIDRDSIVKTALFGHGTPLNCGSVPSFSWAHATCKVQVTNLDKAKQLMIAAGYKDGFSMTIKVGADYKSQVNIAQAIQAQLQPLNIKVQVVPMEWGLFLNDFINKNFDAVLLGWVGSTDPDDFFYNQFHTGEKFNVQSFSNKQVDTLLEAGRRTTDQAKRKVIYQQVQQLISEQVGYVFIDANQQYELVRPAVQGYEHYANGSLESLKDVWIKK